MGKQSAKMFGGISMIPKLKENPSYWAEFYLFLDVLLIEYLKKQNIIDFHIMIDSVNNKLLVQVIHNSKKDLSNIEIVRTFKNRPVSVIFTTEE